LIYEEFPVSNSICLRVAEAARFWRRAAIGVLAIMALGSFGADLASGPAIAMHWETAAYNATIKCADGRTCALEQYVAVYGPPSGPVQCTQTYQTTGGLGDLVCGTANHLSGHAWVRCDGAEQGSMNGCGVPTQTTPCICVADPVDPISGILFEDVTDFTTGGDHPLSLKRRYWSSRWSMVNSPSRLGQTWSTNFDATAFIRPISSPLGGVVYIRLPDGQEVDFNYNYSTGAWQQTVYNSVQNNWQNVPGSRYALISAAGGTWVLTDQNDTQLTFNSAGQLITIQYRDGYTQTLAWSSIGQNTSVIDSFGRTLTFSYNSIGYLSQVATPDGKLITYTYSDTATNSTNTVLFVSGSGTTTQNFPLSNYSFATPQQIGSPLSFDGAQLSSVVYADGKAVSYQYSTWYAAQNGVYTIGNRDLLTGKTDERGVQISTWTWDSNERVTNNVQASNAQSYALSYNTPSRQTTVANPLGKQAVYTYNGSIPFVPVLTQIQQLAAANSAASTTTFGYDSNVFINQKTDGEGRVTTYTNESRGLPTSIVRGAGTSSASTTSITWHSTLHVPTQIVEPGRTTAYSWNSNGQLTSKTITDTTTQTIPYSTSGQTRNWTYAYNGLHLASVTDPAGSVVSYTYDSSGYVQTITNEMGLVTTINATNGLGQPTKMTDANGVVTNLSYDARGRLTSVSVDANNTPATTSIAYNATGDVTSVTDPIGATTTLTYDSARRVTQVKNAVGETINYTLDAMGNATAIVNATSSGATAFSKTRVFDELGRFIKQMGAVPANSTYQYAYDRTDNLVAVTDPRSNVFSNGYDAVNRLITQTNEENAAVSLTRNGADAITGYTDARNLTTTYIRNGFGEVIQEKSPDRGVTTYLRDARGLITQKTDPRGIVSNFQYDAQGRLTYQYFPAYSSYWQGFDWDVRNNGNNVGLGNLVGIHDEAAMNWRVFDGKGRIIVDWRTNNPAQALPVNYSYDLAGNVTSVTYPSGRVVVYTRDAVGRITAISTAQTTASANQAVVSGASYLPFGPLSSFTHGNGLVATLTYDTDYRMTRVQVGPPGNLGGTLDRSLNWTGDDVINAIVDNQNPGTTPFNWNSQTQTFTYTPARRLSSANGYYGALSWSYDANGNRLKENNNGAISTYVYSSTANWLGSITASGSTRAFTYDAAGNTLTDSRASAYSMAFQYDPEGRLASATQPGAPGNGGTYAYDQSGLLASRTVNQTGSPSTTTLYVYDLAGHVIAETNTSGVTQREYIWLGDLPVAVVAGVNTSTPTLYYVHADHLGRPARMTAQNWAWVWDVIYSPFGATSYIWTNPATMDLRFPGQWFQLESGLAYNWHRHYDPTIGRYIQPDPLGYAGGRNLYAYARGNPLLYVDPDGRNPLIIPIMACAADPACLVAITAITTWIVSRPAGMDKLMERAWDRFCTKSDDPCSSLKNATNIAITQAEGKMEAMLADKDMLFGTQGWINHANDLNGRIENIRGLIRLGKSINCDMSAEEVRANELAIPSRPRILP
jgi:RHS repeat-associated protein